jgi:hypothetical protein
MTALGRITSTRVEAGDRLRVQPWTVGIEQRPSFLPARNLKDSTDATVVSVERLAHSMRTRGASFKIQITVRTDDGAE